MKKIRAVINAFCLLVLCLLLTINAMGQQTEPSLQDSTIDLTEMSLEELAGVTYEDFLDMVVSGLSKTPKSLSDSSAAYFVIDQEDIRRSGAQSIPELLRMVPGINVARIDANKWAVTARGFNDRFANNLLVMVDGRNVYSSFFSGVHWDVQDYILEDIDRIEVIRGPGASLWGANATNGVINIVTKNAKDTQGGLLSTTVSTDRENMGSVRYGDNIGESTFFRVYGKYKDHPDFPGRALPPLSAHINDEWNVQRGGFRLDSFPNEKDKFTFQGDMYKGNIGSTYNVSGLVPPYQTALNRDDDVFGGNFLSRYSHTFEDDSEFTAQMFYDHSEREYNFFQERTGVFDIDLQYYFTAWDNHHIIVGGGYRYLNDDFANSNLISFNPENRDYDIFNIFIQDDIHLLDDKVILTLGAKFEHNDFSGYEIQPTARLLWKPYENHILWAAVTRAVRTPSRAEHDIQVNSIFVAPPNLFGLPFPIRIDATGDRGVDSVELLAYEIGYRFVPKENLFVDLTGFYNDYHHLQSLELDFNSIQAFPLNNPPFAIVPVVVGNKTNGNTYGFESSIQYAITNWWNINLAYSFLDIHLQDPPTVVISERKKSPQNQISFRSGFDLPHNVEFDVWLRYTDQISSSFGSFNFPAMNINDIYSLDMRVAWKPKSNIEISVGAHGILDSRTSEFVTPNFIPTTLSDSERSVYTKFTWTF